MTKNKKRALEEEDVGEDAPVSADVQAELDAGFDDDWLKERKDANRKKARADEKSEVVRDWAEE